MDELFRKAFKVMVAARPASGCVPETPAEWSALLAAHEEMGYALYRSGGHSHKKAQALAAATHGGVAGRLLLEIGFGVQK